jgi:hypothetical protein
MKFSAKTKVSTSKSATSPSRKPLYAIMIQLKQKILITIIFAFSNNLRAEGQEGLVLVMDILYSIFIIILWTLLYFLALQLLKHFKKKENELKQKIIVGLICLISSIIHYQIIKL